MAAAPAPKKKKNLDDVLAAIDRDLSKVHRIAKRRSTIEMRVPDLPPSSRNICAPTRHFDPAKLKRTKMMFQTMADDPILMDSAETEALEVPKPLPRTQRLERPGGNGTKAAS